MSLLSDIAFTSTALDRPMQLELIDAGNHVIIRREAHSEFVRQDGEVRREMAIDTFKLDRAALNDTTKPPYIPVIAGVSNTRWMGTLQMGDRPGHMIWAINGRKFLSADELPTRFRRALKDLVPGALERTIDWD